MLKVLSNYLKEKFRKTPKTWFTSDTHFMHRNVLNYCKRPFKDVYEMNEAMIKMWNKTVKPFDTVYHIGDFSMGNKAHKEVVHKLNGRKILISGNHCPSHISHKKSAKMCEKLLLDGWMFVFPHNHFITLKNGMHVQLCHLPYAPDEGSNLDTRYLEFRPKKETEILLCGHLHGRFKKKDGMIDVGYDAHAGKMLSEDQIIELINDSNDFIKSPLTDYYLTRKDDRNEPT